ncbi:hypothetical protein MMC28_009069 [Mycoblastus sanguinarius]|nr:hypothetical protein [Mycoblastus sanguinarius]
MAKNNVKTSRIPPEITQPKSIINAARDMRGLPREIVHQILDDLPLFKVLQLVACREDSGYFDECLLGHMGHQRLFPTFEHLSFIRRLFKLSYEICSSLRYRLVTDGSLLARNVASSIKGSQVTYESLRRHLHNKIARILKSEAGKNYLKDRIPQDWHPTAYQPMSDLWRSLQRAVLTYKEANGTQMMKMASICETWPQMMKKASDPAWEPRRNTGHVPLQIRIFADKLHRNVVKRSHLFRYHLFPLVPFDIKLQLFVKTLQKHPLPTSTKSTPSNVRDSIRADGTNIAEAIDRLSLNDSTTPHSETIITDIEIALAGMAYVYTNRNKEVGYRTPKVLRTKFTPWSAAPFRKKISPATCEWPVFMSPPLPHLELLNAAKIETSARRWYDDVLPQYHSSTPEKYSQPQQPYHELEVEWLEAFLRAVSFMEGMPKKSLIFDKHGSAFPTRSYFTIMSFLTRFYPHANLFITQQCIMTCSMRTENQRR